MKTENIVCKKSYSFAIRIVHLFKSLNRCKNEYVLSRQILKSGTSIGANIEESIGAQSDNDFLAKISIAYKEARETHYWLRLLNDCGYIENNEFKIIKSECEELLKIIGSIQKTVKTRLADNTNFRNS